MIHSDSQIVQNVPPFVPDAQAPASKSYWPPLQGRLPAGSAREPASAAHSPKTLFEAPSALFAPEAGGAAEKEGGGGHPGFAGAQARHGQGLDQGRLHGGGKARARCPCTFGSSGLDGRPRQVVLASSAERVSASACSCFGSCCFGANRCHSFT